MQQVIYHRRYPFRMHGSGAQREGRSVRPGRELGHVDVARIVMNRSWSHDQDCFPSHQQQLWYCWGLFYKVGGSIPHP